LTTINGFSVSKLAEHKLSKSQDREIIFIVYSLKKMEAGLETRKYQLQDWVSYLAVFHALVWEELWRKSYRQQRALSTTSWKQTWKKMEIDDRFCPFRRTMNQFNGSVKQLRNLKLIHAWIQRKNKLGFILPVREVLP
jgi:hypothetical protein